MNSSTGQAQRLLRLPLLSAVILVLVSCVPVPAVDPPRAPAGSAGAVVHASAGDVALSRSDLPAGFQLAAEKASGPEYLAMYLRPSALDPAASGGNTLLSVITSVGVYSTTEQARAVYLQATLSPDRQAVADASLVSKAASDVVTESFTGTAQGVDASQAYRVTYRLSGKRVYEYGHRLRMGNTLAYVVVAALGTPDEPKDLLKASRDLVQRQIDRIAGAVGKDAGSG